MTSVDFVFLLTVQSQSKGGEHVHSGMTTTQGTVKKMGNTKCRRKSPMKQDDK
jgi:hypothetical protein